MSELKIFYKENEKIKVAKTINKLKELDKKDIIWIDLLDVSDKTEDTLEDAKSGRRYNILPFS